MKNRVKLIVVAMFGLFGLLMFLGSVDRSIAGPAWSGGFAPNPTPTPPKANKANTANKPANAAVNKPTNAAVNKPANTPVSSNTAANTVVISNTAANTAKPSTPAPTPPAIPAGKTMRDNFTLGQDSQSEYGAVPFNHKTHAFLNYSLDGKSVVGCVECHHSDQPKSALKLPLITSERDVTLTFDVWKTSSQKVSECRACHFQAGGEPDGKTMPTATYTERGKSVTKALDNELAYHINCNVCHDAAAKLRPELQSKKGFAIGSACATCHSGGN